MIPPLYTRHPRSLSTPRCHTSESRILDPDAYDVRSRTTILLLVPQIDNLSSRFILFLSSPFSPRTGSRGGEAVETRSSYFYLFSRCLRVSVRVGGGGALWLGVDDWNRYRCGTRVSSGGRAPFLRAHRTVVRGCPHAVDRVLSVTFPPVVSCTTFPFPFPFSFFLVLYVTVAICEYLTLDAPSFIRAVVASNTYELVQSSGPTPFLREPFITRERSAQGAQHRHDCFSENATLKPP